METHAGQQRIKAFAPICGPEPRILLLGTMPSAKSLEEGEYYAHPRNLFWQILGEIFTGEECSSGCSSGSALKAAPYIEKQQFCTRNKIAVWDVLASCERQGSLDSAIKKEQVNPLESFLRERPSIELIGLNGRKAEALFLRNFPELCSIYRCKSLPSTSPAHAAMSFAEKLQIWYDALCS